MKKILASTFVFALAASVGLPTFAANSAASSGGDTSIPVAGTYQASDSSGDVISVDIVWDSMDFIYTTPGKGSWNPESHEYDGATKGGWTWQDATEDKTAPLITLTNHSNVDVEANFAFNSTMSGVNGNFTEDKLVLNTAENTTPENAPKAKTAFTVDGNGIDADRALGAITVTVAKYTPVPQMISTAEELLNTGNQIGVFNLANDIDLGNNQLEISSDQYVLDLNGYTLSGDIYSYSLIVSTRTGSKVTIKNGSIENTHADDGSGIVSVGKEFVLENCKVIACGAALSTSGGTARITDCKFEANKEYAITIVNQCDLTISGDVKIISGYGLDNQGGTTKALAGSYNFDVTDYVDTNLYNVTNDGTTWTVTAK